MLYNTQHQPYNFQFEINFYFPFCLKLLRFYAEGRRQAGRQGKNSLPLADTHTRKGQRRIYMRTIPCSDREKRTGCRKAEGK